MKRKHYTFVLLFSLLFSSCFRSTPSDVVVAFIEAVENKKFDEARALSTPETAKLINLQESISGLSQDSTPYSDVQLEIIEERIEGDTAFVKCIGRDEELPSTIKLVKTNGEWLVHISKADMASKSGFYEEEEEDGFFEADEYSDVEGDSLDELIPDTTAEKVE